jgi:hypothetical protein
MIYDPYRITSLHQKSTFPMSNWIWIITQHTTRWWRHRATPKRMCISLLKSALGEKWKKRASNRSRKATLIFSGRESRPLRRAYFRKLAPTPIVPTILFPWANYAFPRGFFCSAPVRGRLAPPAAKAPGRLDGPCTCGSQWRGRAGRGRERLVGSLELPTRWWPLACPWWPFRTDAKFMVVGGPDELRITRLLWCSMELASVQLRVRQTASYDLLVARVWMSRQTEEVHTEKKRFNIFWLCTGGFCQVFQQ